MDFSNEFFMDEVREGFYVSSLMKRAWAAQLEILSDIDRVCKKHNIRWFMDWGTLLGAVRHKGFIPWDDDLDICMLRADYERFSKEAYKELNVTPEDTYKISNFFHSGDKDVYDNYLTRVRSGSRIRVDEAYMKKFHGFPYVTGIDIFPLDYMQSDAEEEKRIRDEWISLNMAARKVHEMDAVQRENLLKSIEDRLNIRLNREENLTRQLYIFADRICDGHSREKADYITRIYNWINKPEYKVPSDCYDDVIYLPFEGFYLPAPIGYDTVLKKEYGDYLVPVRDGAAHEYPFFDKQIALYEEDNKPLYKRYEYHPQDLCRHHAQDISSIKDITKTILKLLEDAHEQIIEAADCQKWEEILAITESCQDGAIALGMKLEEVKGEGFGAVKILEEYCELLYEIHESIMTEGKSEKSILQAELHEILIKISDVIDRDVLGRKEIVFLPFSGKYWNIFSDFYRQAAEKPDVDVFVVPIPYYEKNGYGTKTNIHYDLNEYPANIELYDYKTFDFGLHHPDLVLIQNPYDDYNLAMCVPDFFYAENIKEYTDCLIYLPYFHTDEIKPTDKTAQKTLEYFCLMPGVVHADKVIVQSESMRETYINALTDFAGKGTKEIWEKKICVREKDSIEMGGEA